MSLEKPARGSLKRERARRRRGRKELELEGMQAARDRDQRCRFPLCGCRAAGFRTYSPLEVSHDRHRGMGGNPTGDRSERPVLLCLCRWRHQEGRISRDNKTFRTRYLTAEKNDGPLAFEVKRSALVVPELLGILADPDTPTSTWLEVARERAPRDLERLHPWQLAILHTLAEMKL